MSWYYLRWGMVPVTTALMSICLFGYENASEKLPRNTIVKVMTDGKPILVDVGERSDADEEVETRIVFTCQQLLDDIPDRIPNLLALHKHNARRLATLTAAGVSPIRNPHMTLTLKSSAPDDGTLRLLVYPQVRCQPGIIYAHASAPAVWVIENERLVLKSEARIWNVLLF